MKSPGWKDRLFAEVESARTRQWQYGTHDCLTFVSRVVLAITGTDYAAPFSYDSEDAANAILDEQGGIVGLLAHILGFPVSPNEARVGDVVVGRAPVANAGICLGATCAFAADPGIVLINRGVIAQAWRID